MKTAFAEFSRYANVSFVPADESDSASIRIAFDGAQAWSAIGTDALKLHGQPTMNLGVIGKTSISDEDHSVALHEVGHVLGLAHEWDGENTHISTNSIKGDKAIAKHHADVILQHAHNHAGKVLSNFDTLDDSSIMRYAQNPSGSIRFLISLADTFYLEILLGIKRASQ